jgi:hypothetical protein
MTEEEKKELTLYEILSNNDLKSLFRGFCMKELFFLIFFKFFPKVRWKTFCF